MYATLDARNPLFPGFSSAQNINQEIDSYLQTGNMKNPQTDFVYGFFCENDYDILILNLKRTEELNNARNFIVLRNTSYNVL